MTTVTPSQINTGDVVRATKGDVVVQGVAKKKMLNSGLFIETPGLGRVDEFGTRPTYEWGLTLALDHLERRGFTFEVIRRATPPTPGIYKDTDGDLWLLTSAKTWHALTHDDGAMSQDPEDIAEADSDDPASEYGPLTLVVAA